MLFPDFDVSFSVDCVDFGFYLVMSSDGVVSFSGDSFF